MQGLDIFSIIGVMGFWITIAVVISILIGICAALVYLKIKKANEQREIAKMIYSNALIIDVRSPEEYALGHYNDAINVPYDEIAGRIGEIGDISTPIVVYCSAGNRAEIAMDHLKRLGFRKVVNGISTKHLP